MPSGVLLGLATACSWGASDFIARFATKTTGSVRALLGVQFWGAVFLSLLLFFRRDWGHLADGSGWQPWAWGLLAGAVNTCAMLALYRAFEIGKTAVVAPLSASYPALTVILSTLSGERFSLYRALGIFFSFAGALLVAAGETRHAPPARSSGRKRAAPTAARGGNSPRRSGGVVWAVSAALGFGVLFWLLGTRIIPATGALATVWMIRITGTAITLTILLLKRLPLRVAGRRTSAQLYSMGFFDSAAFALSNLGMGIEQVAVVSLLGSLYGAVTVALAAIFLREPMVPLQWSGIAAIFLGIAFMNW